MKLTKSQLKQIIKEELEKVFEKVNQWGEEEDPWGADPRNKLQRWVATKVIKNLRGNDFLSPGAEFVVHDTTGGISDVSKNIAGNPGDPNYSTQPRWAHGEAYKIDSSHLTRSANNVGVQRPRY